MLRVIKSELYKTCHRLYPFVFSGVIVALGLLMVFLFAFTNPNLPADKQVGFDGMIEFTLYMLPLGLYLTVAFVDMVFSEEYKNQTMKNPLAFGIPRTSLYLGKLAAELTVAVISLIVILGVILGVGLLLLGPVYPVSFSKLFVEFGQRLLVSLPLWIGALSFGNMLAFHFKSSTLYTLFFIGLFAALPVVLQMAAYYYPFLGEVRLWLMTPLLEQLANTELTNEIILRSVVTGAAYLIGSTLIGLIFYRKKEIH